MPATISPIPSTAAPTAQLALNASGASDADIGTIAATDTGGSKSFAALFQKLAGRQLSAHADPSRIVAAAPAEVALTAETATDPGEAGDALATLLPFLEAMGFTPKEKEALETDIEGDQTPFAAQTDPGIAVPVDPRTVAQTDSQISVQVDPRIAVPADPRTVAQTDSQISVPVDPQTIAQTDASLLAGIATALAPQINPAPAISAAQPASGNGAPAPAQPVPIDAPTGGVAMQAVAMAAATMDGSRSGDGTDEFASRFAAALEAAGDKSAGTPVTANSVGVTQQPSGTPAVHAPTLPVEHTVGTPGWGQEVGNRIVWMANRQESRAELVLTPPQMGRVEVSLSISGDQASASFVSNNPAVREALEAALPRLREVLSEAGIQLGQAQVGAENAHQSAQQEKNGDNFGPNRDTHVTAGPLQTLSAESSASAGLKVGRGLVDVFA